MKERERQWCVNAIGLCCVFVLIWVVAPAITLGDQTPFYTAGARVALCVAFVVTLLCAELWSMWLATRQRLLFVQSLRAWHERFPVHVMGQPLSAQCDHLESQGGAHIQAWLTRPWVLVIGRPGAGKSHVIQHTGAHDFWGQSFQALHQQATDASQDMVWWFGQDSVWVEASHEANLNPLFDFLEQHKHLKLLSTVVVVWPVVDLKAVEEPATMACMEQITDRLNRARARLQHPMHTHVVLSQGDQLNGFVDFFKELSDGEREQIWGATFAEVVYKNHHAIDVAVIEEFDALLKQLRTAQTLCMLKQQDPDACARTLAFPLQVDHMKESLFMFLRHLHRRLASDVWLRGLYFTSARQDTPTLDVMGDLAQQLGVAAPNIASGVSRQKGYFIRRLFHQMVQDALSRRSPFQWFRISKMAHVLVLCVACITAVNWVQTTRSTLYDIDSVRAYWGQAGRLLTQPAEPVRVVEGLSLMQRALGVLKTDYVERGWMTSLGFHQEWALRAALSQQYRAALSARLFPVLLQQLEQALQATKPADQLYEALFVYRMLYEPESRPVYLAFLRHWFLEQTQWTPTYKVLLGGLMDDALMSREVPGDWDGELFVSAQRRVDQATAWSDMMYYDVRIAAQNRLPYHQYHLSMSTHNGLVHAFDDPDFQNKIPFIYTPEGASVFLDMLAAMRNLPTFDAAQVEHIQSLYMRDYTAAWDRLLASLRPKRFQGPSELKAWLDMMLLSSDNPWRALAQTVREQTDVQAPFANHLVRRMRDHFASWHAVVQQEQVWLRLQDDLQALRRAPLAQKSLVLARTAEHVHAFPATLKTWIMDVAQQVAMLPA